MKNIKISATLGLISLVCALLIALMNMVTKPIITTHDAETELETCKEIFAAYDKEASDKASEDVKLDGKDSRIIKIIIAEDSKGNSLGTIYKVSGKNAYGTITLMVGVTADNKVCKVEFLENGQSFASTVNNHVLASYPSSESTDVHVGAYTKSNAEAVSDLEDSQVNAIDVKCGATYGATLVKELVQVALNDAINNAKEAE